MVWILVVIGAILLVGLIALVIFLSKPTTPSKDPPQPYSPPEDKRGHDVPTNFRVFNYLPSHSVDVSILDQDSKESINLVKGVKPNKTGGISKDDVERYLKPGNILRTHITDPSGVTSHYTDTAIDNSCYERIKNLHVGMVTTRFIGKTTDGLRMSTLADNAIQGHAWLMIHNLTECPLRLNDDIIVAPHCTERYLGYLHQGVTLGTIFKDRDGVYPDFQYLNPHSDLYYGVVSDLRQPLYGPFQLEFNDDCDADQTLWPFELGQM